MNQLPIIVFALILSFVPFSVALSSSVYRCIERDEALRMAFVFALFQAGMMALGWLIGYSIKGLLFDMAVPVAALIVFFIGARIFLESRRPGRQQRTMAVADLRILFGYAFVIGINTAMISMALGILYQEIALLSILVFSMVFIMTLLGVLAGKRGMMNLGRSLELLGGISMAIISVVIIMQYLKIL